MNQIKVSKCLGSEWRVDYPGGTAWSPAKTPKGAIKDILRHISRRHTSASQRSLGTSSSGAPRRGGRAWLYPAGIDGREE
jgi:hypothetical protein